METYLLSSAEENVLKASPTLAARYSQWRIGIHASGEIAVRDFVMNVENLYDLLEVIGEKRPKYLRAAIQFAEEGIVNSGDQVLLAEEFDAYYDLLFTILFELERREGIARDTNTLSFYIDCVLGVFLHHVRGDSTKVSTPGVCSIGRMSILRRMGYCLIPPGSIRRNTIHRWVMNILFYILPKGSTRRAITKRFLKRMRQRFNKVKAG